MKFNTFPCNGTNRETAGYNWWIRVPLSFWLTMKLSIVFVFAFCMYASAGVYGQKVTISSTNASFKQVMQEIQQQTGFSFFIKESLLAKAKPVSVNVENEEVEVALRELFKSQPFDFDVNGSFITAIAKRNNETNVAEVDRHTTLVISFTEVRGQVIDSLGKPIRGASVRVLDSSNRSTKLSTHTDENGAFTLADVPQNAKIQITFVGFEALVLPASSNLGRIVLKASIAELDEVQVAIINTGYQTLPKERSAGSFAQADVAVMRDRPTSVNVLQLLDGAIPGLTINNAPGAEQVLIRGLNSINATRKPLVVVDGVALEDINNINPQDIENVTVLKDATAASIWGARAANGVIVLTTKRGSATGGLRVEYDGSYNFQGRPDIGYHDYMSSSEFVRAAEELFNPTVNAWSNMSQNYFVMPHEHVLYDLDNGVIDQQTARRRLDSLGNINNRGQINDLWIRNAALSNHHLSLSNGNERYRWYGSAGYTTRVSNTVGENDDRYKLNIRQDFTPNNWLQFHIITDLSLSERSGDRPFSAGANYLPYQLFVDANGNPIEHNYMKFANEDIRALRESQTGINLNYSPVVEMNSGYSKANDTWMRTLGGVKLGLFKGLNFEGLYGFVRGNARQIDEDFEDSYVNRYKVATLTAPPTIAGGEVVRHIPATGGIFTTNTRQTTEWTVRNQLQYQYDDQDHFVALLVGQEAQERSGQSLRSRVLGYNSQMMTYANIDYAKLMSSQGITGGYFGRMALDSDDAPFVQGDDIVRFTSYYANAAYSFKNKYTINGSWRRDESNLFGRDKAAQGRPIWSVGAKWNVKEEFANVFANVFDNVSELSLRMSYGLSGNSPLPGSAASFDILSGYNSNIVPGGLVLDIETPGNAGLTWESTKTWNAGIDFAMLNNRLSGSLDVYDKHTSGLIGVLPLNMLTGQTSTTGNIGDIVNHGFELALRSTNIQSSDFVWTSSLNVSFNKNKLTEREDGYQDIGAFRIGYPAFPIFAYDFVGLSNIGDPIIRLADGTETSERVSTDLDDWLYQGTSQPVWNGGFTNTLKFKDFGLHANLIYNFGHVVRRPINIPFSSGRLTQNVAREFDQRWKQPGDEAHTTIPAYVTENNINSSRRNMNFYTQSTINVISGSYIKLRDLGLSYHLPKHIAAKVGSSNARLMVQTHNYLLWKANDVDVDPEFLGNTPVNQRSMSIGLRASF